MLASLRHQNRSMIETNKAVLHEQEEPTGPNKSGQPNANVAIGPKAKAKICFRFPVYVKVISGWLPGLRPTSEDGFLHFHIHVD